MLGLGHKKLGEGAHSGLGRQTHETLTTSERNGKGAMATSLQDHGLELGVDPSRVSVTAS